MRKNSAAVCSLRWEDKYAYFESKVFVTHGKEIQIYSNSNDFNTKEKLLSKYADFINKQYNKRVAASDFKNEDEAMNYILDKENETPH